MWPHKLRCEAAPLLLGLVLAPLLEDNLRRSLLLSRGDPMIFVERPLSLMFLVLGVGFLMLVVGPAAVKWWRERRATPARDAGE